MILATLAHGGLPERLTYDMRVGLTATADMKRFEDLKDPQVRLINRRLKENRAELRSSYASPDYFEAQGGDLPGFIRGLYRDILGPARHRRRRRLLDGPEAREPPGRHPHDLPRRATNTPDQASGGGPPRRPGLRR